MYPFTPSQWRELEQQALIFKYLACGLPIPPDLILHVKKSFLLDMSIGPNPTLGFLSPQIPTGFTSSDGWASMQMGFGRRREDPEPGRCRRTDGKKWRCSKEVFADSKYCERHMHRGKNRSRKLVELSLATNTTNAYSSSSSSSPYSLSKNPNRIVGMSLDNLGGYYGVEKKMDEEKLCKLDQCESKRNGFWWESNESQKNRTLDLTLDGKPNQFVLGSNFIKTEIAEKPKSFHCFFN